MYTVNSDFWVSGSLSFQYLPKTWDWIADEQVCLMLHEMCTLICLFK